MCLYALPETSHWCLSGPRGGLRTTGQTLYHKGIYPHWLQPKFFSLGHAVTRTKRNAFAISTTTSTPADPASKHSTNSAPATLCARHIQTARPCPTSTQFFRQLARKDSKAKTPQCLLTAWTRHAKGLTRSAQSTITSTLPASSQNPTQAQCHALEQITKDASVHRTHSN